MEYNDPLKTMTETEFRILALLEMMQDELWIEGTSVVIDGVERPMHGDTHKKSVEEVVAFWKEIFKDTIEGPEWGNGRHVGDCTRVPCTCNRCLCEDRLLEVKKFIETFNKFYSAQP
jgi:hypothetical protein